VAVSCGDADALGVGYSLAATRPKCGAARGFPLEPTLKQRLVEASAPASPVAAVSPSLDVATSGVDAIEELLQTARLAQYTEALRGRGCITTRDLRQLGETDLIELGMKPLEIKR
jgi:hypothetical protein